MHLSRRGGSFGSFLAGLVVAGAIAGAVWYFVFRPAGERRAAVPRAAESPPARPPEPQPEPELEKTERPDEGTIARKLREWNLTPEDLKRELASAGKIVREKGRAIGDKVAMATSDVTIITKIKAKYALDDHLQALKISVGCKDGQVQLTGSVAAPELIGRAVLLAIETEGVVDVESSLSVAPSEE